MSKRKDPAVKANKLAKNAPVFNRSPSSAAAATEKAVSFGPSLKRLIGFIRPERRLFLLVILMDIVSVTFIILGPMMLGKATDILFAGVIGRQFPPELTIQQEMDMLRAQGNDKLADMVARMSIVHGQGVDIPALQKWLLLALALYLVAGILAFAQSYLLSRAVQRTAFRMREQLRMKIDRLPLRYFDSQPRGELLSRMTNDMDNIRQTLQYSLDQLLNAVLTVIGVTIMMFLVSPVLAVITLAIIPVSAVLSTLLGKQSQKQFARTWKETGELNSQIEEAYSGHTLVKVFGHQNRVQDQFDATNGHLCKAAFKAQFISKTIMPLNILIGNANYVAIAVVGGLRVASGRLPLGNVQAFIQYSRMFSRPISQIASLINLLQSGVASAERIFEVLDSEEMDDEGEGCLPAAITGHVEFNDVSFSYDPDHELIEGLTLKVSPGQSIAIVGPTGAGKTTLVNLLERFYDIDSGQISIDGVDISSLPRSSARKPLGMVLQDSWLFQGSIRDNICYGKTDATEEEIIRAAKQSHVDQFVHALPDGYDTIIRDEGDNISAGEKQLITIARAFIRDPEILILDEATSSVDTRTESLIQHAMGALRSGRTSFVIAHRLSTIRDADLIVVMDHGTIVEKGTHNELLAAKGDYSRLYISQFSAAVQED